MKKKFLLPLVALLSLSLIGCDASFEPTSQTSNPEISSSESEPVDVDRQKAQEVIDMIDALDEDSTAEEIYAVIAKYNDLTARQKAFVTNYDKLEALMHGLEKKAAVQRVIDLINAINADNPSEDAVVQAREAYDNLLATYGQEWADKVTNLQKLIDAELAIVNRVAAPLINKALNLNLESSQDCAQFKLLSVRIEDFLSKYADDVKATVSRYQEYVQTKAKIDKVYSIAGNSFYNTTHNLPESHNLKTLETITNDDYGYVMTEDFAGLSLTGSMNIQFATQNDYSNYKYIGLFVSYPFSGLNMQFINDENTVYVSPETVANEFMYMEIPTRVLTDLTGNECSHVGAYFTDISIAMRDGYYLTSIVGIGIDEEKAQAAVDAVDAMIEALNEDNLNQEDVEAARAAYDALLTDFDETWQAKVKASNVEKLIRCEAIIASRAINILIDTLLDINSFTDDAFVQRALLAENIDAMYAQLNEQQRLQVERYDEYLIEKEEIDECVAVIYNDGYTIYDSTAGVNKELLVDSDDRFGSMYYNTFNTPTSTSLAVQIDYTNKVWTSYSNLCFFAQFDSENTERIALLANDDWDHPIWASSMVIDETSHLYFYEFNLDTIPDSFTTNTYFQVYFSNPVNVIRMTNVVGIKKDLTRLNNLIALANSVDISTNQGLVRFMNIANTIESVIKESDKPLLTGYSDYATKHVTATTKGEVLFNGSFTTSENGDWPELIKVDSSVYGEMRSHTFGSAQTSNFNVFFNCRGADWSQYSKMGIYVQLEEDTNDRIWFIMKDDWSITDNPAPVLVDATNHIYYCEFNISALTGAFEGNPYLSIYLTGSTTFVKTTLPVAIKD